MNPYNLLTKRTSPWKWQLFAIAAIAVALLLGLRLVTMARAASVFTVDSTSDAVDDSLGDGDCHTAAGVCTLRAAIQEANALAGPDIVILPSGTYTITIGGTGEESAVTGDLDISDTLTISGSGAATTIIDGGGLDRVIDIGPVASTVVVTIENVTIRNGIASSVGGGIVLDGGTLNVINSIIVSNTTGSNYNGGGISIINGGRLTVLDSTIINNTATASGGGISVDSGGRAAISNTSIVSNTAAISGGGIYNSSVLTLTNSTVVSDTAPTGAGGGIYNGGAASLQNVTFNGNGASSGGGIRNTLAITLTNTIVANSSSGGNCNNSGTFTSLGYNLSSDTTCTSLIATGDITNVDPFLGPLQDNGGPNLTHALLAGSPAIDAGSCVATTDQRGQPRPGTGTLFCDIGAYELQDISADLTIAKSVIPAVVQLGQPVTYTLFYTNDGPGRSSGTVITDIVPVTLTNVSYVSSGAAITPMGGASFVWQVADLAVDAGGIITITGIVDPALARTASFTNRAVIASAATDDHSSDNASEAEVTAQVPVVAFSGSVYSVAENVGSSEAVITATLDIAPAYTVTVDYATAGGTATAGSDYTAASGTLSFAPGVTSQTFTVPITNDALYEGDETVGLALSNVVSATLGSPNTATLTIVDDEAQPSVRFSASAYSVNEAGGSATITVTLSGASAYTATVDYATADGTATAGSDYTTASGILSFAPGVTSRTFAVPITNDAITEGDETVGLALSDPDNATLGSPDTAVLTIVERRFLHLPFLYR